MTTLPAEREASAIRLDCEAVKNPADRRRVVYWRYRRPGETRCVGAVSRRDGGWRAIGYPLDGRQPTASSNTDLGTWPDRAAAESRVKTHAYGSAGGQS